MKKVFKVILSYVGGTVYEYELTEFFFSAVNDLGLRERAEQLAMKKWKKKFPSNSKKFPGVDYAEIEWICDLSD